MENIGLNIRAVRKACGLTLQQVGIASGYDAGNLSKLERGLIDWSGPSLRALADAMNVPLKVFFLTQSEIQVLELWSSLGEGERAVIARMAGSNVVIKNDVSSPMKPDAPSKPERLSGYRPPVGGKVIRLQRRYEPPKAAGGRG